MREVAQGHGRDEAPPPGKLRWKLTEAERNAQTRAHLRRLPLRDQVFYEQSAGVVAGDVVAIFRAIAETHPSLHGIWALRSEARVRAFTAVHGDLTSWTPVLRDDEGYLRELYRSRYIVVDDVLPGHFVKRPGQVVVHTGRGPAARMMRDSGPPRENGDENRLRTLLLADVLLVPDDAAGERLRRHWQLDPLWGGAVVPVGPLERVLRLESLPASVAAAIGLDSEDDRPLLLVCLAAGSARADVVERAQRAATNIAASLGSSWDVAVTVPPFSPRWPSAHDSTIAIVPAGRPSDLAFARAAAIVCDTPDVESDARAQGAVAITIPSDSAQWTPALWTQVREAATGSGKHLNRPAEPASAMLALEAMFTPKTPAVPRDSRRRLLIHLGSMKQNGITSAGLALVGAIDHEKWDVTVHTTVPRSPEQRDNVRRIDPRVRVLSGTRGRAEQYRRDAWRHRVGRVLPLTRNPSLRALQKALSDEWARSFGRSRFDTIIDFSGYSPYYAALMRVGDAERHLIWAHNDLTRELNKEVQGVRPHMANLKQTFSLYQHFDAVVSVSPELSEIHSTALRRYAPATRFECAPNLVLIPDELATAETTLTDEQSEWIAGRGDGLKLITMGRLSPEKNHARLLRALAKVRSHGIGATLAVLGSGPLEDDLQALARSLGVDEAVSWFGHVARPAHFLRAAQCLVMSSDYEGAPMAILEARSLGLPVITTRFATVASAVPPSAGIICDATDESLADAVIRFASDGFRAERLDVEEHNATALASLEQLL